MTTNGTAHALIEAAEQQALDAQANDLTPTTPSGAPEPPEEEKRPPTPPVPFSAEWFAQEIAVQSAIANQLVGMVTAMDVYQSMLKQQAIVEHLKQQQALLTPKEPPKP